MFVEFRHLLKFMAAHIYLFCWVKAMVYFCGGRNICIYLWGQNNCSFLTGRYIYFSLFQTLRSAKSLKTVALNQPSLPAFRWRRVSSAWQLMWDANKWITTAEVPKLLSYGRVSGRVPRTECVQDLGNPVPKWPLQTTSEYLQLKRNLKFQRINIVTCRVVRATKMTGSSSDDWIY
jgi:hypothetical protein